MVHRTTDIKFEIQVTAQTSESLDVKVIGILDDPTSREFSHTVGALISPELAVTRIDMSEVAFMSSAGVSALLKVYRKMKTHDGRVLIVDPTPAIEKILKLTRLDGHFPVERRGSTKG